MSRAPATSVFVVGDKQDYAAGVESVTASRYTAYVPGNHQCSFRTWRGEIPSLRNCEIVLRQLRDPWGVSFVAVGVVPASGGGAREPAASATFFPGDVAVERTLFNWKDGLPFGIRD